MRKLKLAAVFLLGVAGSHILHAVAVVVALWLLPLTFDVPPPSMDGIPLDNEEPITPLIKAIAFSTFLLPAAVGWLVRNRWRAYAYGCVAYVVVDFVFTVYVVLTRY